MAMSTNANSLYVGSLITSVIGAALLLFGDFAAWEWWNAYLQVGAKGYLDISFDNMLVAPFLLVAVGSLGFCAYFSYLGIMDNLDENLTRLSIFFAIGSIGIQLGVFIIFALINIIEDNYWWADVGFYGGVIGGALTLGLLYMAQQQRTKGK